MPIKFSQFTNRTSTTAGTTIVGFDGNQNIKILSSDLVSGFINGTTHTLPVFTTANTLGDSIVAQDASATQLHITGDVGIGTTTPNQKLHVVGHIRVGNNTNTIYANRFKAVNDGDVTLRANDGYDLILNATTGDNVGIGTTSPGVKLDVDGDVRVSLTSKFTFANGQYLKDDGSAGLDIASISAAGTINFITNSTDQMIITSAGDVGIGTTAPGGKLEVNGGTGVATSGGTLIVRQDGDTSNDGIALTSSNSISHRMYKNAGGIFLMGPSTDSDAFALDLNGNVGIGTTSPGGLLHVSAGDTGDAVVIIEADADNTGSENDNPHLELRQDGASIKAKLGIEGEAGNTYSNSLANATYLGTVFEQPLQFITGDTGSVQTAKMTILANTGNVGIGHTAPASILHIKENTTGTGTSTGLTIEQDGAGDAIASFLLTGTRRWVLGVDNSDSDKFKLASTTDLDSDAAITVTTGGFVGIGTTSPGAKLQVVGELDVSATSGGAGDGIFQNGKACMLLGTTGNLSLGDWDGNDFQTQIYDNSQNIVFQTFDGGFYAPKKLVVQDGSINTHLNYIGSKTHFAYVQADSGSVDTSLYIARSGSGGMQSAIEFYEDSTGTYRDNKMIFKLTQPQSYNTNEYMTFQYSTATTSLVNIQAHKPIVAKEGVYIGASGNQNSAPHHLDDYEEGSFTPTFYGTSGLAITYDSQVGRYVKVGRAVHAFIELGSDAVTYASGNLEIHGLPFVSADVDAAATVGLNYSFGTSLANYTFSINDGGSKINIYLRNVTTQYPASGLGTGTNNNRLRLTMTYLTTT
jgi:hypothetical protein|tara:strand:- start:23322 stop:25739 length:2418 start_codon:yes stop_codon:yes gene_type:complete